jgi:ribosomal protein S18 acetylase RimI-like enzyme
MDDAACVNELLAAAEAVDHTEEHYSLADVVEELENPMVSLERDWLVVEHAGRVVAHSRLMPRAADSGSLKVQVDGTVHPDHRRQGIGSQLIPRIVARARDFVHEHGADLRPVITADAAEDNRGLTLLLEREGMHVHRWSFVMQADLLAPVTMEGRLLPEGYELSTWDDADHHEVRAAHNAAFADHPGYTPWSAEMWTQWVEGSRNFRPALSLLVRDAGGDIAAYLQTCEYDAVQEAIGVREAYVAKVGTVGPHRHRGIAGAMLWHALHTYRDAGFERAQLDVDSQNPTGALGIYQRAGFRATQTWATYLLETQ